MTSEGAVARGHAGRCLDTGPQDLAHEFAEFRPRPDGGIKRRYRRLFSVRVGYLPVCCRVSARVQVPFARR